MSEHTVVALVPNHLVSTLVAHVCCGYSLPPVNHLALPLRKLLINIVLAVGYCCCLDLADVALPLIDLEAGNSKEEQGPWRVEAPEMVSMARRRQRGVGVMDPPSRCPLAASRPGPPRRSLRPSAMLRWCRAGSPNRDHAVVCPGCASHPPFGRLT